MTPTERYTIEPVTDPDEEAMSRLVDAGRDTGTMLPGRILEAQFKVAERTLLVTSHDVPYEDALEICLLSQDDALLDRITLSWPYSTGHFGDAVPLGENRLAFHFFDEKRWIVTVLDRPRMRLPLIGGPSGAWRPFGFKTWLTLRAEPLAPTNDTDGVR